MSRRKHPPRRLGFSTDSYGRSVSDARDGAWSDDTLVFARWVYLHVLARQQPVLTDLGTVESPDDVAGLTAWLTRWELVSSDRRDDWTAAYARGTLRVWANEPRMRGRIWAERDDVKGALCSAAPDARQSRPLKHPAHFEWLAQRQSGGSWAMIAAGPPCADPKSVREAVTTLAAHIRLSLRTAPRGRPARRQ
jgi:hypothetical protein